MTHLIFFAQTMKSNIYAQSSKLYVVHVALQIVFFFLVRLKFQSRLSGIVCTAKYLNIAESLQVTDRVPNRNPCLRTAIYGEKVNEFNLPFKTTFSGSTQ